MSFGNDETKTTTARRATLYNARRKTVIATSEEVAALPCANKAAPIINETALLNMLHDGGKQQYFAAKTAAFKPDRVCDIIDETTAQLPVSAGLPGKRIDELCEICMERVTTTMEAASPTRGGGQLFFVIETKTQADGSMQQRTRAIFWPRTANAALKSASSRYNVHVHMKGIVHYIDAVKYDYAVVGDISSGFTHFEIPAADRCRFRWRDERGQLFQMTRLPMGHVASVQMMEVLTLALIGSQLVCATQYVNNGVRLDGFVDDFRICGNNARRLQHMIDIIKQRAKQLNVLIKDEDQLKVQQLVTYLGVNFDHEKKLIGISNKTLQKLPVFTQHMQAGDVYRGVARLIYCAGPLNINIGDYYFAIKQTVRITHNINKREYDETQILKLQPGLVAALNEWRDRAHQQRDCASFNWQAAADAPAATIYSDASLFGYGGVLIFNGAVHVVGGAWTAAAREQLRSGDISWLEMRAVRLVLSAFHEYCSNNNVKHIDLVVDNTSVQVAITRGRARAEALQMEMIGIINSNKRSGIELTARYIDTRDNIADAVSRGAGTGDQVQQWL